MNNFLEEAIQMKEEIVSYRRLIHENPEVGPVLLKTKDFVMTKLKEFGYEPKEICESGIVATIRGKKEGKTILLRADMDALPVKERTQCSFKSTNGAMHACGHDMHTAMLLGAAKILQNHKDEIEGTIKLVFQPDEEGFTGAKRMIKAGVLENPKVDVAAAMHVYSGTPSNIVLCGLGTTIAGCRSFKILVDGKECHGAMPEKGIDPINIAAHVYLGLQELISREISGTESAIVTIGKFVAGSAPNIIPEEVEMEGTIRTLDKDLGTFIFGRIKEMVEELGKAFRGRVEVTEIGSAPPLTNDKKLTEEVAEYMKEVVGEKSVVLFEGGGMGSEDFSSYSYEVPSVYFMLGAGVKTENPLYGEPMHNPEVVFNEDILPTGVALHVNTAIEWLKNNK